MKLPEDISGERKMKRKRESRGSGLLIGLLFFLPVGMLISGFVMLIISGDVTHEEPLEYIPYRTDLAPGTMTEINLVSCDYILETERTYPFEIARGDSADSLDPVYLCTYAKCADENGASVILAAEDILVGSFENLDTSFNRKKLLEKLSSLSAGGSVPLSFYGCVKSGGTNGQSLSKRFMDSLSEPEREEAIKAFSEIKNASAFVSPYLSDVPTVQEIVDYTIDLEKPGGILVTAGYCLFLCILPFLLVRTNSYRGNKNAKKLLEKKKDPVILPEWTLEKLGIILDRHTVIQGSFVTNTVRLNHRLSWEDIRSCTVTLAASPGSMYDIKAGNTGTEGESFVSGSGRRQNWRRIINEIEENSWLQAEGASEVLHCPYRVRLFNRSDVISLRTTGIPEETDIRDFIGSLYFASLKTKDSDPTCDFEVGKELFMVYLRKLAEGEE